jgi:transposase
MSVKVIGLDIAKHVFQVHGGDGSGKAVLRKRLRRNQLTEFFGSIPRCVIGMEATPGAHYWARVIGTFGHEVKLIAPQFVKPYVKGQKNDSPDAAAICEAVSRPEMRFVPQKSIELQDLQALHRIRSRLLGSRTQLGNQIRGLLAEYGIIVPLHLSQLRLHLSALLDGPHPQLTSFAQELFASLYEELCAIDDRVEAMQARISRVFADHEACQKIAEVEGVGPLIATAVVAAIADGRAPSAMVGSLPLGWGLFLANTPAETSSGCSGFPNGVTHIYGCCLSTELVPSFTVAARKPTPAAGGLPINSVGAEQRRPVSRLPIRTRGSFGLSWQGMSRTAARLDSFYLLEIAQTQGWRNW